LPTVPVFPTEYAGLLGAADILTKPKKEPVTFVTKLKTGLFLSVKRVRKRITGTDFRADSKNFLEILKIFGNLQKRRFLQRRVWIYAGTSGIIVRQRKDSYVNLLGT
jgi:hypothetical protein